MKLLSLIMLSFLASACTQNTSEVNQSEVKSLITRAETCIHFSGEFNGDHSDRDKEVIAEMDKLKCADIDKELLAAKEKYKNNPELLKSLAEASANY
jgi:hypothetical protein